MTTEADETAANAPGQPAAHAREAVRADTVAEAAPEAVSAAVADGHVRQLDPRYVTLGQIVGRIVAAVVAVLTVAASASVAWLLAWPAWRAAGLAGLSLCPVGLLAWWLNRWPVLAYRHASYVVDEHVLEIRRGVVWRHVIRVPRSRVQHIDVSQGPLERRLGLGTLVTHTAGTIHAQVELAGLDHATAVQIRDSLLPRDHHDAV